MHFEECQNSSDDLDKSKETMKILVTGAAGMLAESLVPALQRAGNEVLPTDIDVSDSGCLFLDVRNYGEVWQAAPRRFRPDLVVHLAAETDVDRCELEPDHAYRTNALGTQNVALLCKKLKIPIVYISTVGVFDGEKGEPYTEFDEPRPINVYGCSKLAGETYVKELVEDYFIIRAGWMIGGGDKDKKFIQKVLDQIRSGATRIYAVTDKYGTPTYAPSFSRVVVKLIRSSLFGTYHLACRGQANRFDVAREMLNVMNRNDIELVPVTSEYFKTEYPAPRPRSESMRNYLLELRGLDEMPRWQDALREYLHGYYPELLRHPVRAPVDRTNG
jgi:dTDP-4-dehydrorhamnose reductase